MQQSDHTDGSRLTTTLARYSALAATAAVPAANAAIVTGSVNDTVGVGGTGTEAPSGKTFLAVDITDELGLTTVTTISFDSYTSYLYIYGADFRTFALSAGGNNSFGGYRAAAGETWDAIGTGTANFGDVNFEDFINGGTDPAGWNNGGFLAFRFDNAGTDNYGWLRLEGNITGPNSGYVGVVDWGYDDTGAKIEMGAVPAPSTGLLALAGGFPAVAAYRRRKREEREAQDGA